MGLAGRRGGRHSFPLYWPLRYQWRLGLLSTACLCTTRLLQDVPWPPRSFDLSTCDFFFWGYLKSRVYTHKPRTLNDLKEAIRQEIRPIDRYLLARVTDNFEKRLENCIQEDGSRLTDIIFKTEPSSMACFKL